MMIPLMLTTLLVPMILRNISQNQLVILKDVSKRRENPGHRALSSSGAKPWKSLNALIKIRSITLRACAITATISMAGIAMPMLALIPIGSFMPRASARTATSTTITSSKED